MSTDAVRVGLIARAENTGLSTQAWEFYRHMRPAKTLLVNMSQGRGRPFRPELYPYAQVAHGVPSIADLRRFVQDTNVVFCMETAYNNHLYGVARQAGVKVVTQLNFEFLDRNATPDLWAAPSLWHWDDIPAPKVYLRVPIALEQFPERPRPRTATRFLHPIGRPAAHDRHGTEQVLDALPHIRSRVTLTIRCQDPAYMPRLLAGRDIPDNIDLQLDDRDAGDYWQPYRDEHVLVHPRRFGGLSLPCQEALGAHMPVIMPNCSPNEWLPADWLIPAEKTGEFQARTKVGLYTADPRALAALIDRFATDAAFYGQSVDAARIIAKELGWEAMRPEYERVLTELVEKCPA